MIKLGDYNTLRIIRFTDHGAYLDGGEVGEILLPKAYVEREMRPDDEVTAFICLDQQERLVATLETPLARVCLFACSLDQRTRRFFRLGLDERPLCAFPRATNAHGARAFLHSLCTHR